MSSEAPTYTQVKNESAEVRKRKDMWQAPPRSQPNTSVRESNPFIELAAKVFLGASAMRVVAVTACFSGEGVSYVTRSLRDFLINYAALDVSIQGAEEFLVAVERGSSPLQENASAGHAGSPHRIVLVDCPPVFSSANAVRVVPHVDGVLLVIKDGERSKAEVQRALTMIEAMEGKVLGAVLNVYQDDVPRWLSSLLS
jgi:Mrp family chromosome partitioning ATPase